MSERLEDLRFVIGIFFAILGCVLIAVALMSDDVRADMNLPAGIAMGGFGALMLAISLLGKRDVPDPDVESGSQTAENTAERIAHPTVKSRAG